MNAKRLQPRRRRKVLSAKKSKKSNEAKQGDKSPKPALKLPLPPDPPVTKTEPLPKDVYNRIYASVRALARCR